MMVLAPIILGEEDEVLTDNLPLLKRWCLRVASDQSRWKSLVAQIKITLGVSASVLV